MSDVRLLWPFAVNWAAPVRVTYQYKTDIFVNRAGGEQRRALRAEARRTFAFRVLLDGERFPLFNRLMTIGQNEAFVVPDVTRRAVTAATSAIDADLLELTFDAPDWIEAGAEIVLDHPPTGARTIALVESVDGDEVTFGDEIGDWPAGTALHPALTGQIAADLKASRATNATASTEISFEVEPGSEQLDCAAPATTLGGIEIMNLPINWARGLDTAFVWPVEQVDFGFGRTTLHRPVDFSARTRGATILAASPAEAEAAVAFFLRQRGRRGTFWLSTLENDLPPVSPLAADSATLTVTGEATAEAYGNSPAHKAVALHLADGRTIYRPVASLAVSGGDSLLTVTANWGEAIPVAQVRACSWLMKARFGSDDLVVEWLTNEVAQMQFSTMTLPAGDPTDWMALRATVEGDDRITLAGDERAVLVFGGPA